MAARRNGLIAGLGAAAALAAGWAVTQRRDRAAIRADRNYGPLFADLVGPYKRVSAHDGTQLAARVFGPDGAPTIVFAHGWTCSDSFWKLQVEALRGERRIVTYDQRGHAESERARNGDYSIETFGRDLQAVLDACVPAGQRALLVGHSLGAMTIAAWAGLYSEQVDDRAAAAVLCNTGVGDLISESLVVEGMPGGFQQLERLAGQAMLRARSPLPAFSTPLSYRMIRHAVVGPDATPAQIAFVERLVLDCPADVRGAVGGTLSRLDLFESLDSLSVPALVIAGERDRLTPPLHAHRMAEALPDLIDVVELPRSGHMSPLELPEQVNELIAEMAGTRAPSAAG
jgi:pimeloyl-ACP methyl ester carboxylesterase